MDRLAAGLDSRAMSSVRERSLHDLLVAPERRKRPALLRVPGHKVCRQPADDIGLRVEWRALGCAAWCAASFTSGISARLQDGEVAAPNRVRGRLPLCA